MFGKLTRRAVRRGASATRRNRLGMIDSLEERVLLTLSTFQQGIDGYTGTVDTFIDSEDPDENNGDDDDIVIDAPSGNDPFEETALLRFDDIFGDGEGQIPLGAQIVSAALELRTTNGGDGGPFHRMLVDWDDSITFNSAGSGVGGFNDEVDIQTDGVEAREEFESFAGTPARNQDTSVNTQQFNVTADLRAWAAGEDNFGWFIDHWEGGSNGWVFSSSEGLAPPKLIVEWVPAEAIAVSFQEGVDGYTGTQDLQINSGQGDSSLDTPRMSVDFSDGGVSQVLMRFDNLFGSGPNQIPDDQQIAVLAATLDLDAADSQGDGGRFYQLNADWDETWTWNRAGSEPGFNGTGGIQPDGVEAATSFFGAAAGEPDLSPNAVASDPPVNVRQSVQNWANGEDNFGWGIIPWDGGGDGWDFASSEAEDIARRPELTVYYVIGEPVSVSVDAPAELSAVEGESTEPVSIVLDAQPDSDVTFELSLSNVVEASLSTETITFTPENWDDPQTVTILATEDLLDDGDIEVTLDFGSAISDDIRYSGLVPPSVMATIVDDDETAGNILTFQEGVDGYTGTFDTEIREAQPFENFESSSAISIDFEESSEEQPDGSEIQFASQGLLRFENIVGDGPGQIPAGSQIIAAQLILSIDSNGDGARMYRMTQNWFDFDGWGLYDGDGEGGIQPGSEARDVFESQVGASTLDQDGVGPLPLSVDVTPDIQAWVDGEANFGWALLPWEDGTDGFDFTTSEGGDDAPILEVVFVEGAELASFQDGVDGYEGTVDTTITADEPNADLSESELVGIDFLTGAQGLLRFDDLFGSGPGQIPFGATIEAAYLDLTTALAGDGAQLYRMLEPFDEDSTFSSFDNGVQLDGNEAFELATAVYGNSSLLGQVTVADGLANVTRDVQAWAEGGENFGWLLEPWQGAGDTWAIASSEAEDVASRPRLTVLFTESEPQTVSAELSAGALIIEGNNAANTVVLTETGNDVQVDIDGMTIGTFAVAGIPTGIISVDLFGDDDSLDASGVTSLSIFANGGLGDDVIIGGGVRDTLFGGDGADTISGGVLGDVIDGGSGDDLLDGEEGNDTILGGAGDDVLRGIGGDDQLSGGIGDDTIRGNGGADLLRGNAGDDELIGNSGDDTLLGQDGDDLIFGGPDNDSLEGNSGDDDLRGQGTDDTMRGGNGADILRGGFGEDLLLGGADNDTLLGGNTSDTLFGGTGDDELSGDQGFDLLFGDDGNDTLDPGSGSDSLDGGAGADIFLTRGNDEGQIHDIFVNSVGQTVLQRARRLIDGSISFVEVNRITGLDEFDAVMLMALGGADTVTIASEVTIGGTLQGGLGVDVYNIPGVIAPNWTIDDEDQ